MADAFPNSGTPAQNATEVIDPRKWLSPGWWWADLRSQDLSAWAQFTKGNPAVQAVKSSGRGDGFTWVLFQVTGTSPVVYTPPGLAYKALKGANTNVEDIIPDAGTAEENSGIQNAGDDFAAFWKKLTGQLGTAGTVLLWGGVAVVLWKLYNAGGAPSSARRSRGEDDYEEREEHHVTIRSPRERSPRSGNRRTGSGTLVSYR